MIELRNDRGKTYLGTTPDGRKRWALDCCQYPVQMRTDGAYWTPILPRLLTLLTARLMAGPLDVQVGAGSDDAAEREGDGVMFLTDATFVEFRSNANVVLRYWSGHRYVSASFPSQGDTIDVAYESIVTYDSALAKPNMNIHFELGAAPGTFITTAGNITGRSRSTASVSWVDTSGLDNGSHNTPSLVTPAQELFDSYSSSAIVTIWRPNTDANYYTRHRPYEYDDNSYGASLHLEWTEAAAGWTNIAKVNGVASAAIAKMNGVAVANIAKVNGVAV